MMNKYVTRTGLLLLLILLLSAFIRFYTLTLHSLWWDELLCMFIANPEHSARDIGRLCKDLYHTAPPTFYVILNTWMKLFGYTDEAARALAALTGVAGTGAMYFLGKELTNKTTALIAAALTTVNYWHLYYSLDVHYYSLLFLLSTLSFLFFVRLLAGYRLIPFILYVTCTWLIMITHHFSLLLVVAQGVIWLALARERIITQWKKNLVIPVALVLIGLLYLPFLKNFMRILEFKDIGMPEPGSFFFVQYFHGYFGYSGVGSILALLALLLFVVSVFVTGNSFSVPHQSNQTPFILCVWLLLPLAVGYLRSVMATTAIVDRYTIVILPALLLAMAAGVDAIKRPLYKYSFFLLLLTGCLTSLAEQKIFTGPIKDDFKGAAQFIREHHSSNKFHLVSDKNWCFKYYLDQYRVHPQYIEHVAYADDRFYVSKLRYENILVVVDTTLKDIWVTTAHFKNMDPMQHLCDTMMQSDRFLLKESFESRDAFARHFIRKY